jgi:hypothetical protein
MQLISIVAVVSGASIIASLLLMNPVFRMIVGRPSPVFPHRTASAGVGIRWT